MSEAANINAVMRTLAGPTRRALFERIAAADEITVLERTRGSGVTQAAISQHLKSLKLAGLVAERPEGRKVYYRAEPAGLAPLAEWMNHYGAFWRGGDASNVGYGSPLDTVVSWTLTKVDNGTRLRLCIRAS
ncbi:MAG: transcriptional regulator [Massilia sp.]|nr:transcriptional regulator [Massilia sp.]